MICLPGPLIQSRGDLPSGEPAALHKSSRLNIWSARRCFALAFVIEISSSTLEPPAR
jgi:hypothetical protein